MPVSVVAVLIIPDEIYAGMFPYFPRPIQRAMGTGALRAACAGGDAGAMKSVALGYLEFSEKAAGYGKLSELVPNDVQLLCLGEEREEPMTPIMYGAIFRRGNDAEARRALKSTGDPKGFCQDGPYAFPEETKLRIISICRGLGLPEAPPRRGY